jgi:hypothetical protein
VAELRERAGGGGLKEITLLDTFDPENPDIPITTRKPEKPNSTTNKPIYHAFNSGDRTAYSLLAVGLAMVFAFAT